MCLCVCVCVCVCVIVQNIKSCSSWVYVCNRRCKCVGGEESECSLCEIVSMVNKRVSFKVFVCGGGGEVGVSSKHKIVLIVSVRVYNMQVRIAFFHFEVDIL